MHRLLVNLLAFWLGTATVRAIFVEDAFETDWQQENIGIYNCVLKNEDQNSLVVLSDYGSKTLLSFLNETNGQIMFRHVLDSQVTGAMVTPDRQNILLQKTDNDLIAYDSFSGLPSSTFDFAATNFDFRSQCTPDLSNVKLTDEAIQILDSETGLVIFEGLLPSKYESTVFLETDYVSNLRLLVHTTEDNYVFQSMRNKTMETLWSRDESNHDIVAHTFISTTDDSLDVISEELWAENSFSNAWEAYIFRLTTNWNRLRESFRESGFSVGKFVTKLLKLDRESLAAGQDTKIMGINHLVVATKDGIIQAFDVQNGKKIWRLHSGLSNILLLEFMASSQELLVFAEDSSFYTYKIEGSRVPVLVKESSVGKGTVKALSVLDSKALFVQFLDGHQKFIPLVNESESPRTFVTTHDSKGVYGHVVDEDQQIADTWTIKLRESEEILAFAGKKDAPIVTLGQTLGNRTVLYKYLYPNLAGYITVNKELSTMHVNLIDTITGELLYSQMHDDMVDAEQPINIVFGEYWLVYSYFSAEPIPEQKLVTIELYESLEANKRVSGTIVRSNPLNGRHKPAIISKAYFFPEIIQRMSLSETIFGITSKTIVLELKNGQITYLSKDVLSARRIEESKMTNDDKKEFMAMPYVSIIPLNDHFIISHSRTLLLGEEAELVSIATNLESTSVVCDIGHDIFCTRISPSGQFDIMSRSFEKGNLVATVVILIVICYFLRPSVEAAKLKKLWLVR